MAQQHAEARGIAEVFAREFYQRFNVDRNAVAPFYVRPLPLSPSLSPSPSLSY